MCGEASGEFQFPQCKDCSAEVIFGGDSDRVGDYGRAVVLSDESLFLCGKPRILQDGATLFGGKPNNRDGDGISPAHFVSSPPESSATSCESGGDGGGSDVDDLDALSDNSIGGEGGRRYRSGLPPRRLPWPKYAHDLWIRSGGWRNPFCIHAVRLYKRSGGQRKPRMNGRRRRRRLRLAKGCTRFTSEVRGDDLLPRPEPVSGEEVGCNGFNGWSSYCGYGVTVNGDGYEGGGSGHCESSTVASPNRTDWDLAAP